MNPSSNMVANSPSGHVSAWNQRLFVTATVVFAMLLLRHHYFIISAQVPLDLYEGTMPFITGIIAEGHNPYTFEYQPIAADVYPPLYNILVAPLTGLFGNTLLLHRLISAFFIFVACFFCVQPIYKLTSNWCYSLAGGVTLYSGLVFYSTPVASTNALGVALFMASVVVPWQYRFNTASMLVACLSAVLSFYTKQYFILGMAIVCLYTFLYVSALRAVVIGLLFTVSMTVCLIVVHKTSPYFIDNTLISPVVALDGLKMWSMVSMQFAKSLQIYSGLLILLAIAWGYALGRSGNAARGQIKNASPRWSGFFLSKPLFSNAPDFFLFGLFWSLAAFVLSMGRNPGNYMTYVFQLISPFFLIFAFTQISKLEKPVRIFLPLVLLTYIQAFLFLPRDFSYDRSSWEKMEKLVAAEDEILASQMLLSMLLRHDKTIYQDGHTAYFPLASQKPDWLVKDNPEETVESIWNNYMDKLYRKVESTEFDMIIISPWEMKGIFIRNPPANSQLSGKQFLKKYYYPEQKIPLSMTNRQGGGTYQLQIWRPKDSPAKG